VKYSKIKFRKITIAEKPEKYKMYYGSGTVVYRTVNLPLWLSILVIAHPYDFRVNNNKKFHPCELGGVNV